MSKSTLCIAVDVGSYSIKGVMLKTLKDSPFPKLIEKKFLKLATPDENISQGEILDRVVSKIGDFSLEMVQKSGHHPEKIIVGVGLTLTDLIVEEWSVKLSRAGRLTSGDILGYFDNIRRQHQSGNDGTSFLPLRTLVNGYKIDSGDIKVPKDTELSFKVLNVKFSAGLAAVSESLKKTLKGISVEFLPILYTEQLYLSDGLKVENAFLIDIGGDATTVAWLRDGILVDIESFPIGGIYFQQGMSKMLDITSDEAEDLKRQYGQGLVDEGKKRQIQKFLLENSNMWQKALVDSVGTFYQIGPLPGQVFVFGGGANIPEVNIAIRKGEWMRNISNVEYPKVNVLGGETVFDGDTFEGLLQGPQDFGLASTVFYLQKDLNILSKT